MTKLFGGNRGIKKMLSVFTWASWVLSIAGLILSAKKNILCWYVWMVADLAWAAIFFYRGEVAEGVLFLVYFLFCFYGINLWKKDDKNDRAVGD